MYTIAMAKNDYKEGWINGFNFSRQENGWIIEVWKDSPDQIKRAICTARGEVRVFKTLDAAVTVVEDIGWSADFLTGQTF